MFRRRRDSLEFADCGYGYSGFNDYNGAFSVYERFNDDFLKRYDDNFSFGSKSTLNDNFYVKDYESLTPSQFQDQINNHDVHFRRWWASTSTSNWPQPRRSVYLSAEEQIKLIHFRRYFRSAGFTRRRFLRRVRRLRRIEMAETYDEDGVAGVDIRLAKHF